jgi:hypothetical protein
MADSGIVTVYLRAIYLSLCYLPFLPLSITLIHIHSPTVRETVSDPTTDRNSYTHSIDSYLKH